MGNLLMIRLAGKKDYTGCGIKAECDKNGCYICFHGRLSDKEEPWLS